MMFLARLENKQRVVVKFTRSYGDTAHRALFRGEQGPGPALLFNTLRRRRAVRLRDVEYGVC